jgi:cysteine-rich repeat protein
MMCMTGACVANTGCTGTPALGCACSLPGQLACNGTAQKLKLACSGGIWIANGNPCLSSENCDQSDGTCKPIISGCSGHANGFVFCDATVVDLRHTCGPDLVTTTDFTCAGVCSAGVCQAARCGDGKVEAGEVCDDGNTTPVDGCEPVTAPIAAAGCTRSRVTSLAMGDQHICALYNGGYVRCWGDNTVGELGLGHTNFQGNFKPYQLTNASGGLAGPIVFGSSTAGVTAIGAGTGFSCALLSDGTVWCWGSNDAGQLGNGSLVLTLSTTPAAVNLGGTAVAIGVGINVACAVLSTGSVRCWGSNAASRLGLGDSTIFPSMSMTPNQFGPVMLGTTATAVAVASAGPCALLTGGTLRCWGDNNFGELGLANKTQLAATMVPTAYGPVPFPTGKVPVSISAGSSFLCSRLNDGAAQCWGRNAVGQLGIGNLNTIGDDEMSSAGAVATATTVTSLAVGTGHVCAVFVSDGGLRCWGDNIKGELGYPDITNRGGTTALTPAQIGAVSFGPGRSVTAIFPGNLATCALLDDNEVRCWGWNNTGQLGLGMVSSTAPDFVGGSPTTSPSNAAVTTVQVLPP